MDEKIKRNILIIEIITLIVISTFVLNVYITKYYLRPLSKENSQITVHATASLTSGKIPLTVDFNCDLYDNNDFFFHWDFDDGRYSNEKNPRHIFKEKGSYHVTLTVSKNLLKLGEDKMTIRAVENCPPIAQAYAYPTSGEAPLWVKFTGKGEDPDGEIISYHWRFYGLYSDEKESDEQNPIRTYYITGVYYAELTVTDNDGEIDTDRVYLEVSRYSFIRTFLSEIVK